MKMMTILNEDADATCVAHAQYPYPYLNLILRAMLCYAMLCYADADRLKNGCQRILCSGSPRENRRQGQLEGKRKG